MNAPNPLDYIDRRSIDLWKQLCKTCKINVEYHERNYYVTHKTENVVKIFVPYEKPCMDYFAHELLHIVLLTKGIDVLEKLKYKFRFNEILKSRYSEEFILHISNCLQHYKMLPSYLALGFDRTKFINSYFEPVCTDKMIDLILQLKGDSTKLPARLATNIIGIYFSIKASPNSSIDYSRCIKAFWDINNDIFKVLDNLWASWDGFDIDNALLLLLEEYNEFFKSFIHELSEWTKNNVE